jgi:hypothetical protein
MNEQRTAQSTYRYNPNDFQGILGLPDELNNFYALYEEQANNRTQESVFAFERHWENLFFTLKHREVEGYLNPVLAADIRMYLEELASA